MTENKTVIITAGPTYLDIDAYACMVALAELINLKGGKAVAYSKAPRNYSVADFITSDGEISFSLPEDFNEAEASYIIVDVSDRDFLKDSVPLDRVIEIYDHHVGFEEYWKNKIGDKAHIEFIGAAATLIYRQWKKSGLSDKMALSTAKLLIAAILDNTLYLTSSNTTEEDREAFRALCEFASVGEDWCTAYFSAVESEVEKDLKNALFGDLKLLPGNSILPPRIAQLCVWDAKRIIAMLPEIALWFSESSEAWMINIIDIKHHCSYFVCTNAGFQKKIGDTFEVNFESDTARTSKPYLRKEIIKKTYI